MKNPLNYNEEMQEAAQTAFSDNAGDFWAEVARLQAERDAPQDPDLVAKRPTRDSE